MNKNKLAFYISIGSIVISFIGVVISFITLNNLAQVEKSTGSAWTMFLCMITILFSNITIAIINGRKYKS